VTPTVAVPHDQSQGERRIAVNGAARDYWDQVRWVQAISIAHLPVAAVPVGRARCGLPARAAYRARLAELTESAAAADAADAAGDPARAERIQAERESLIRELTAAAGLRGRPRLLGAEAERGRKAVTARIRHTIGRIARGHPELAAHLDSCVHTGARCCYRPTEPVQWQT